jgi:hypothetical protein
MARRHDPFVRARLETLEHALCNPALGPNTARCIGLILLRYCNREEFERTGHIEAWPSIARLAAEAGVKEDTASAAVAQACAHGYFERVRQASRGRGHTARYRMIRHAAPPVAKHPAAGGISTDFLGAKTPSDQVIYEADLTPENTGTAGSEKPGTAGRKTPDRRGVNPSEPLESNPGARVSLAEALKVQFPEGVPQVLQRVSDDTAWHYLDAARSGSPARLEAASRRLAAEGAQLARRRA